MAISPGAADLGATPALARLPKGSLTTVLHRASSGHGDGFALGGTFAGGGAPRALGTDGWSMFPAEGGVWGTQAVLSQIAGVSKRRYASAPFQIAQDRHEDEKRPRSRVDDILAGSADWGWPPVKGRRARGGLIRALLFREAGPDAGPPGTGTVEVVPLPPAGGLLIAGLAALLVMRRRHRNG